MDKELNAQGVAEEKLDNSSNNHINLSRDPRSQIMVLGRWRSADDQAARLEMTGYAPGVLAVLFEMWAQYLSYTNYLIEKVVEVVEACMEGIREDEK